MKRLIALLLFYALSCAAQGIGGNAGIGGKAGIGGGASAGGGISYVAAGQSYITTTAGAPCTVSVTLQAGDTLVGYSGSGSLSGSVSMTWNSVSMTQYGSGAGNSNVEQHVFHLDHVAAGATATASATLTNSGDYGVVLMCGFVIVRGAQAVPSDIFLQGSGTSSTPTESTGTLSQANELVLGLASIENATVSCPLTWASPLTAGQCELNGTGPFQLADGYEVVSSTASQTASVTATVYWIMAVATIQTMRQTLFTLALLLCAAPCFAGTYTAATCSRADVNSVINGPSHVAVDGDKIIIPAGTCTWTSGITITAGIDITGSGTPNTGGGTVGPGTSTTTISMNFLSAAFYFSSLIYGETAEVELINFPAQSGLSGTFNGGIVTFSGTCTSSGCANVRADNLSFDNSWDAVTQDGGWILVDNVFGVADHNYSKSISAPANPTLTQINFSSWQGVGSYGDNSFASADTFGTAQSFYIENNSLDNVRGSENDVSVGTIDTVGGARYVCRFNTVVNMSGTGVCSAHGTAWSGHPRGQRQVEVYYNTISNNSCNAIDGLNSGTGYYFSNSFTGSSCNNFTLLDIASFVRNSAPWFACDGTQPWDQTPWSSTTQCIDQPGRGAGLLLAGTNTATVLASAPGTPCTTAGQCWTNPALDPVYEAGETTPNNAPGVAVYNDGSSPARLLANRDYYAQVSDVAQTSATSPFNGTSGTGYGTLARRPTTCTTGVGYWATDQGTWNTYNSQEGTLYICTATNTWTSSYVPYTYPHPLTVSGGGSTAPSFRNGTSRASGTGIMR